MAEAAKDRGLNLPAGLHSFPALRKAGGLYFDKTPLMRRLLAGGRHYFLTRPAGFGKTLLLTALRSFFSGEAWAFRGLSLEAEAMRNAAGGFEVIYADLDNGAEAAEAATEKIEECAGKDKPTVLLADGFMPDLPELRDPLLKLLKSQSRLQHRLDFVILAGRSPFTALAGDPEPYGLLDISADPGFSALCGLTPRDIRRIPDAWLRSLASHEEITLHEARELLRERARSGRFATGAPRVYCPADILSAITSGTFCDPAAEDPGHTPPLPPPDAPLLAAMKEDLEEGRPDEFMVKLRAVFSSVAYGVVHAVEAERHFQAYVFLLVRLMGFPESELERLTSAGRIDMRVATRHFIYLFEFKTNGSAASALSQIRSRGYLHADQSDPRPVWLIGANYSIARRSIADWKIAPGRKVR